MNINSNTIFKDGDATEPEREVGSTLMSYGDPRLGASVLLLPPKNR